MAPSKTKYTPKSFENTDKAHNKKILVLCVDQGILLCQNDKKFKTGNHPVELFLVLMHLENAGFTLEFSTLTGDAVCLEDWAFPDKDENVIAFKEKYQSKLDHPRKLSDILPELNKDDYAAIYIPGGQGAIQGLPTSEEVKSSLQWFLNNDRFIIVICHGPAALLSLNIDAKPEEFPLKDYEIACFPSSGDNLGVSVGYLPGKMPWDYEKELEDLGMHIANKLPIGITHVDRHLISGDSPLAANKLGILAAETLLEGI